MFALSHDAGRAGGLLGNSANVVYKHYHELVTPNAAKDWVSTVPDGVNILLMLQAAIAAVN